jgi:hypothetical protein
LGVEWRMNRTTLILFIGFLIGLIMFLGFYIASANNYSIFGIPPLEEFIAMFGLIVIIICGFFLISLKTIDIKI